MRNGISPLDYRESPDRMYPVKQAQDYSSAMGCSAKDGGPLASHHAARDAKAGHLTALPSPSPTERATQGLVAQRPIMCANNPCYCPLCCVALATRSGSGIPRATSNLNPDQSPLNKPFSYSSASGESKSLPELPYGMLWEVCSWCDAELGAQLVPLRNDGEVSHGMCRPCFAKQMGFLVVLLIPYCLISMVKEFSCV